MTVRSKRLFRPVLQIAVTSALACALLMSRSALADTYQRYQQVQLANDVCQISNGNHSNPCCTVDGTFHSSDETNHPKCPTLTNVNTITYDCATDAPVSTVVGSPCANACTCNSTAGDAVSFVCDLGGYADDTIVVNQYGCEPGSTSNTTHQPEQCDGLEAGGTPPFDKGCGNDPYLCSLSDADPAPVRFSSGRVQSNPIDVFHVPTPDGIYFGYRLVYNSHAARSASRTSVFSTGLRDVGPTIHHSEEDGHFVGRGWLDNYHDRLLIDVFNLPQNTITWIGQDGTVTFTLSGGVWSTPSGKYVVVDRGASPADGYGRWVVMTSDTSAPREAWAFEEFTYAPYNGTASHRMARLRRHALLTSDTANLTGRYGLNITWTSIAVTTGGSPPVPVAITPAQQPDPTISMIEDTLGRRLYFTYTPSYTSDCSLVLVDRGAAQRPRPRRRAHELWL